MNALSRYLVSGFLSVTTAAAGALACATPSQPPPPPPPPPIVCCVPVVIICKPRVPPLPPVYRVIYRYFLRDGGPLWQSNPMLLVPGQRCLCSIWKPSPLVAGGRLIGFSFGPLVDYCDHIPPNTPPYGGATGWQVEPVGTPAGNQVLQYNQQYANAAGIPIPTLEDLLILGFSAPGQTIPPNSFFDIFVEVELPPSMDPHSLSGTPPADMATGVFLEQNGQVFVEPAAPGPPLSFGQFIAQLPTGQYGFWKIRPYRWVGPLCPDRTNCAADINADGMVGSMDLALLLGSWGGCPS